MKKKKKPPAGLEVTNRSVLLAWNPKAYLNKHAYLHKKKETAKALHLYLCSGEEGDIFNS